MGGQAWYIQPYSNSNLYMEVRGDSPYKGAVVQLGGYTGQSNQQWIIDDCNGSILSASSGLALDIGSDPNRGQNMIQWPFHFNGNQVFDYYPGTLTLQARTGLVLDATAVATGVPLVATRYTRSWTQQWRIVSVRNRSITYRG
jgi:hypothetical protein